MHQVTSALAAIRLRDRVAIATVMASVAALAVAILTAAPSGVQAYTQVIYQGQRYDWHTLESLRLGEGDVRPAGTLDSWSLLVGDPTAHVLPAIPAGEAIFVWTNQEQGPRLDLFVRDGSATLPAGLCRLFDPRAIPAEALPCAPPEQVRVAGWDYNLHAPAYVFAAEDLAPLAPVTVVSGNRPAGLVETALAVAGVDPASAIALQTAPGVHRVYLRSERPAVAGLCPYLDAERARLLGDAGELPCE